MTIDVEPREQSPERRQAPIESHDVGSVAAYRQLPLGSIRPQGWLERQLRQQASNITGKLEEIWADVGPNSGWLGGPGESWERGPYYLDGLVPLAYILDDPELIARARPWIEWVLGSQLESGQFGPRSNEDWWPRMIALKALIQFADATDDPRVAPFVSRYAAYQLRELPTRPLGTWAAARGADNALSIMWLYDKTGDRSLLDLVAILESQTLPWSDYLARDLIHGKATSFSHYTHGPNVAMGLRADAIWYLRDHDDVRRTRTDAALANLDRWHGQVHGWPSGDEWLAGREATQGLETCQVVEYMFTAEVLARVFGDSTWGDQLESLAFNLLAASSDSEMRAHQYLQQPNQIASTVGPRQWSYSSDDANVFGLEPHFGCCTANLHQGWPKFVGSLWATAENELAAIAYAPCAVDGSIGGERVTLDVETDYPFNDTITIQVNVPESPFALGTISLRIPAWCSEPVIAINGNASDIASHGSRVSLTREWRSDDVIELSLPAAPVIHYRERGAVGVRLGPLQMVLTPGENWSEISGAPGIGEWHVHPRSNWNNGIVIDGPRGREQWVVRRHPSAALPFHRGDPPVSIDVHAAQLHSWRKRGVDAGPPPDSPTAAWTEMEPTRLVPYGSARLRISEIPVVRDRD